MKGTFRTSSAPRTCAARSRVTNKIEIKPSASATMRGTMTYTTSTLINPLDAILWQEAETREESSHSHAT
jgi:hypothetical protein